MEITWNIKLHPSQNTPVGNDKSKYYRALYAIVSSKNNYSKLCRCNIQIIIKFNFTPKCFSKANINVILI